MTKDNYKTYRLNTCISVTVKKDWQTLYIMEEKVYFKVFFLTESNNTMKFYALGFFSQTLSIYTQQLFNTQQL